MLFGKRLTGQLCMCGKDMNNVSDIFENGLDRDTYRALKKMNREEMETFLKNYRKDALKEIKDNYFQLELDDNGNYVRMNRDMFKLIHSELIQQVQCIEHNLKVIYATINSGDFVENFESLSKTNLGMIIKELKKLELEGIDTELTEEDYKVIDEIRIIRNYWCHQCYIDYVYISDDKQREKMFQFIAGKLHYDELQTNDLSEKIEKIRLIIVKHKKNSK